MWRNEDTSQRANTERVTGLSRTRSYGDFGGLTGNVGGLEGPVSGEITLPSGAWNEGEPGEDRLVRATGDATGLTGSVCQLIHECKLDYEFVDSKTSWERPIGLW